MTRFSLLLLIFALPLFTPAQGEEVVAEPADVVTDTATDTVEVVAVAAPELIGIDALKRDLKPLTVTELEGEVKAWQARLQQAIREVGQLEVAAATAEGEDRAGLLAAAGKARETQTQITDRFKLVLDAWVAKGGDDASYRKYIAAVSGISVTPQDPNAAFSTLKQWLTSKEGGIRWGMNIVTFLAILVVTKVVSGIIGGVVKGSISRVKQSDLLKKFIVGTSRKLVMVFGFVIALSALEIDIGPLLAGIGVVGFVLGFALQETLSNFAAGFMILLYRPYDVGDAVTAGGVSGKVDSMSLVSTTILSWDNKLVVVPNGKIWGDVITNATGKDTRRVDLVFGIGYDDDIAKAEQILTELVEGHELVLKDPAPTIKLNELADSSVNFIVRPWAKTGDYWAVYWDLMRSVKLRFDEENITIPYPQRDVHLHQVEG